INIGIIYYPYASNMDEFDPLIYQDDINLVPITKNIDFSQFDAIILPGSKNSGASLDFLNTTGLSQTIKQFQQAGKFILGICGGLQILGETIFDPLLLEGGDKQGLGLINLQTTLQADKSTKQTQVEWLGCTIKGYEIHHGETVSSENAEVFIANDLGWKSGNTYTTYLHGVFENSEFYNWFMRKVGGLENGLQWSEHLEIELDKLAVMFDKHGWL
ncbi:MAG: cobyric acid synthase, partial [Alteromonadales bacterium]|nr:cobyric acid synthase [Alteromonadales bacterium]